MAQLKRDYEVSVWTLQDEFLSILKASNIENKGQIEKPDFRRIDDGTEEFTFSIPMYLYNGKKRVMNPLWNDTKNGVILQDMRKVKVTFNKNTSSAKTFEFVITKIDERHENDQLYCDVECGGLAFHELGKTGYKISMTADDFNDEDYRYFTGELQVRPRATLQYWMKKIMPYLPSSGTIDPAQWYYKIEMDWGSSAGVRSESKIYEDPYVKSWEIEGGQYVPLEVEQTKEKERLPDINESNLYNITQDLAKLFGVFCRYEYEHNDNLNIIKRVVVFYNSYMREKEGYIDLTYPYSTSAITRTRDSNDLSTKMFVRPVDDEISASGQITIIDVEANKLHEDYLLNFEYLYKIGNITRDQYEAIYGYEIKIGQLNKNLQSIEGPLMALYNQLPELNATATLLTNSVQLDTERIGDCNDLLNELTDETGEIVISNNNPRTAILVQSSKTDANKSYHINLTDKGILPETVKIYYTYDFVKKELKNEVSSGTPEYDEFNNLIRISSIFKNDTMGNTVYLTYKYIPQLCYENVKKVWEERLNKDTADLEKTKTKVSKVEQRIKVLEEQYNNIQIEKSKVCKNFEKMLGPALRESYWQPEDYKDCGNNYVDNFTLFTNINNESEGSSRLTKLFWDTQPFDNELEKTGYQIGITQNWCGYPVIDLSGHEEYLIQNYNNLSFMFYDFKHVNDLEDPTAKTPRNMKIFTAGSTAEYGFIAINNIIKPVLIITGFDKLSDDSRKRLSNLSYSPTVGVIDTKINGTIISTYIKEGSWIPTFLNEESAGIFTPMQLYYPRIRINSLSLKIDNILLGVKYKKQLLTIYEDYDVLIRDDSHWQETDLILGDSAYYIILKPKTLLARGSLDGNIDFKFNISNADIAIYLDALKVLEENSQPKVSYTIEPSLVDEEFLYTLYNKLCRICNINDYELKFDNVQGYISEININCDDPSEDSIEIKNYKTKFEDLFSSIVAQTEAMKKSAFAIDIVSDTFNRDGSIAGETLQQSIDGTNLQLSFNNNNLTITNENGILGISDSGAVVFRNDGIFTAVEKDSNDNWKWNSAILPSGINANLITAGQLDTNRIKIYSGDKVRFQLNGEGIFAYKSFFEDLENYNLNKNELQKINSSPTRIDDIDSAQYVVMNENGLFLWGKKDALILNKEGDQAKYTKLEKDVARVEVSWDGFKLRNWNNDEVFYADPDTGNLTIKGTIYASNLYIGDNNDKFDGTKLTGTSLIVDANEGKVSILSEHAMNLETNGLLSITGNSGVEISSTSFVKMKSALENIDTSVLIDTNGIEVTGQHIKLNGIQPANPNPSRPKTGELQQISLQNNSLLTNGINQWITYTAIELSNDGIDMQSLGNVKLQGNSGSIEFLDKNGEVAFSIDPQGVITCKKIICTGEIVGVSDLITEEQAQDQANNKNYTLYLSEGAQKQAGVQGHYRISSFSSLNNMIIEEGTYVLTDLKFKIKSGNADVENVKTVVKINNVTVFDNSTNPDSIWSAGTSKEITITNQNINIGIIGGSNKLAVTTEIRYDTTGVRFYTEWDLSYTNMIKIQKIQQ